MKNCIASQISKYVWLGESRYFINDTKDKVRPLIMILNQLSKDDNEL